MPHRLSGLLGTCSTIALAAAATLALAGCGLGAAGAPTRTRLTVTDGFGTRPVAELAARETPGEPTVMRLLEANTRVATRDGSRVVERIDGRGASNGGRPIDWFFYVNGIAAEKGAATTKVHSGDRIWWDRHDWGAATRVPAVVGSFPEPFLHGTDGKRLPVRIECTQPRSPACRTVADRLTRAGVIAAQGGLQTSLTKETLRILVGSWPQVRADGAAALLERGPRASGVYARPAPDGRSITVLDGQGRATRTLRAGAGLVAATRLEDGQPVWVVTGTDDRGVLAAAGALSEDALGDHFALAIAGGLGIGVPEVRLR